MENKILNLIAKYQQQIDFNSKIINANSCHQFINALPQDFLDCAISQIKLIERNEELNKVISDLQSLLK